MKMKDSKLTVTVLVTHGWRMFVGRILEKLFNALDITVKYELK